VDEGAREGTEEMGERWGGEGHDERERERVLRGCDVSASTGNASIITHLFL